MSLSDRVADIRLRVAEAARASGRRPSEVQLVGVCKRQSIERIIAALDCGITELGENTAQGLADTAAALSQAGRSAKWHFVGLLQRNKVKTVLRHCTVVHSIDRMRLAEALSRRAGDLGTAVEVFVQVNLAREAQKTGVEPDEAVDFACAVAEQPGLKLRGLMALPPARGDPRPHFEALAQLSQALRATEQGRDATGLSMGMSADFERAIECGATVVRLGTVLFGPRKETLAQ